MILFDTSSQLHLPKALRQEINDSVISQTLYDSNNYDR